jgi:plastocyanin
MKKIFLPVIIIGIILFISGCTKTELATLPTLTTTPAANITSTTATSGGNISSDGNASITARGVCWSTSSNPSVSDSKTTNGSGTGEFISNITGLTASTTYFLRAYSTNSAGTAYGNEISFSTNPFKPAVLSTAAVSGITISSAVSGGNITSDNGAAITSRGICWNVNTGPTIAGPHTSDGTGIGAYVSNLSGLLDGKQYFVRAYATNSSGTFYGNEVSFTTVSVPAANTVTIQSSAFTPKTLTISVNSVVKWTNSDGFAHTVTSDNAVWDSGNIPGGGTFSFNFTATGTYNYHCTIHPSMTGTIIVQ